MSYDIHFLVKPEGCDKFVTIGEPEYDTPTYNLRTIFTTCMDWDYESNQEYACDFVLNKVEEGLKELKRNPNKYRKLEPENHWGTYEDAIKVLEGIENYLYKFCEDEIPLRCIYMRWCY